MVARGELCGTGNTDVGVEVSVCSSQRGLEQTQLLYLMLIKHRENIGGGGGEQQTVQV